MLDFAVLDTELCTACILVAIKLQLFLVSLGQRSLCFTSVSTDRDVWHLIYHTLKKYVYKILDFA